MMPMSPAAQKIEFLDGSNHFQQVQPAPTINSLHFGGHRSQESSPGTGTYYSPSNNMSNYQGNNSNTMGQTITGNASLTGPNNFSITSPANKLMMVDINPQRSPNVILSPNY